MPASLVNHTGFFESLRLPQNDRDFPRRLSGHALRAIAAKTVVILNATSAWEGGGPTRSEGSRETQDGEQIGKPVWANIADTRDSSAVRCPPPAPAGHRSASE